MEGVVALCQAEIAPAVMLEIATVCKALPGFDTLQIVHFLDNIPTLPDYPGDQPYHIEEDPRWEFHRRQVGLWKDAAVIRLGQGVCGERAGETKTRKKSTVRVIGLKGGFPRHFEPKVLVFVEVEEHEVQCIF